MSKNLERLVGRAVVDEKFRHALLADPEGAAKEAGFELNEEEMAQIKAGVGKFKTELGSDQLDQMFEPLRAKWF